ncbi:MAG TPA: 4-alpha-glucanotransferase [Longimicrobiaceae bacterium]|nr:4-alpha-glucanotransferase [Longimicrobiaceae bacterium]
MEPTTAFDPHRRGSGVLLHPTSLPGPGIGDLGAASRRFVDWLERAGQSYWQILPHVPVGAGGSPYNGLSALAGNPLLVSPATLLDAGLLDEGEARGGDRLPADRVDYPAVLRWKNQILARAHARLASGHDALRTEFDAFRRANDEWLEDYALFRALRDRFAEACWTRWPAELRARDPVAIARARAELAGEVDRFAFQQFLFDHEWRRLRRYAGARGVRIVGDLPIFVAHDSADVWANPEIFQLDADGEPRVVAGVPPDYFSETGQRWGNPLYRWDVLGQQGYHWWVERFRRMFEMVDVVRIDHFRGFESYWEIPADAPTAIEGRWVEGPGADFFRSVERQLGHLPVIAEDLGLITPAVEELRDELAFPGMRVLQFAFNGDPGNPHLPENYPQLSVGYTGTHDNDTTTGWWRSAPPKARRQVARRLGTEHPSSWDFIRAVFESDAALTIIPLQDVLGLGSEARMNTPGVPARNWTWRIESLPSDEVAERLRDPARRAGRA